MHYAKLLLKHSLAGVDFLCKVCGCPDMSLKYDGHSGEKVFSLCIPKISGGKYCLHDSLDWDIEIDENAEQHDVLYWKHLRDFPFDALLYKDN